MYKSMVQDVPIVQLYYRNHLSNGIEIAKVSIDAVFRSSEAKTARTKESSIRWKSEAKTAHKTVSG
jgi:hypothetical protein